MSHAKATSRRRNNLDLFLEARRLTCTILILTFPPSLPLLPFAVPEKTASSSREGVDIVFAHDRTLCARWVAEALQSSVLDSPDAP